MALGLVRGLDRHVEESPELLIGCGSASFRDRIFDAVGRASELSPEP
jgi:hypothetical protein